MSTQHTVFWKKVEIPSLPSPKSDRKAPALRNRLSTVTFSSLNSATIKQSARIHARRYLARIIIILGNLEVCLLEKLESRPALGETYTTSNFGRRKLYYSLETPCGYAHDSILALRTTDDILKSLHI